MEKDHYQLITRDMADIDTISILHKNCTQDQPEYFQCMPTEILASYIFPHLDGVTFIRCRRVCQRWKTIIDTINTSQLWNTFCQKEYGDSSDSTFRNSSQETSSFHIYRNLYGWPRIRSARCSQNNIVNGPERGDVLRVTTDGTLVAIKTDSIQFYNLNNLQPDCNRSAINGRYLDFQENDRVRVLLCANRDLCVTKKILYSPKAPKSIICADVNCLFLDKMYLYYIVDRQMVYRCKLGRGNLTPELLGLVPGAIMQMNVFHGQLYVRSYQHKYWLHKNDSFIEVSPPLSYYDKLGALGTYNNTSNKKVIMENFGDYIAMIITNCELSSFIVNTFTYNSMLILCSLRDEVYVYCLKRQQLLLEFHQASFESSPKIDPPIDFSQIQVQECPNGYTFITASDKGNCVTKFYHST